MIAIQRISGVLNRIPEQLSDLPYLQTVEKARERKTTSPCGTYACKAFEGLGEVASEAGLACISGATGATVKAFDKAWKQSPDGSLTGAEFARRAKRIHPFTLVRSLQNQVPAVISMKFGIRGPCINALDAATAFSTLLPNINSMLEQTPQIVLVLAAAGDREEEHSKVAHLSSGAVGMEGALCFLLTRDGSLGYLEPSGGHEHGAVMEAKENYAPPLAGGLSILQCIAEQSTRAIISLKDFSGYRTYFEWRNP